VPCSLTQGLDGGGDRDRVGRHVDDLVPRPPGEHVVRTRLAAVGDHEFGTVRCGPSAACEAGDAGAAREPALGDPGAQPAGAAEEEDVAHAAILASLLRRAPRLP